ncbi:MAG: DUF1292 domain-containing protein [Thermoguttaceae bacterium]|jgi:hypothetical protein
MNGDRTITFEGPNGEPQRCRVLMELSFEEKEYVLLLHLDSSTTVVMEHLEEGDKVLFRPIKDDAEFERVTAYLRELAKEMEPG